jgi:hypothetical protein
MNILTQVYRFNLDNVTDEDGKKKRIHRQLELDACLLININQTFVKRMYVFVEFERDLEYYRKYLNDKSTTKLEKVTFINLNKQARYKDFIVYARNNIADNEVVCILATDIYMDASVDMLFFDDFLPINTIFGITRHEPTDLNHTICNKDTCCLTHSTGGCGDCFIFRTPVPKDLDLDALDHKQNFMGGECNVIHQFYKAGSKVYNPCFQVRTIHLHKDSIYFKEGYNGGLDPNARAVTGRPYLSEAESCPTDTNHCINRPSALYNPGTVKCFRCKAWPNIFCRWHNGGQDWTCSVCEMYNAWDQQHGYRWRAPRIGF